MATRKPLWMLLPLCVEFIYAVAKAVFRVAKGYISYKLSGKFTEGVLTNPHTWAGLKQISHSIHLDVFRGVREGEKAYNADLVALDGTLCKLFDHKKAGRLLVLNFGSCTCGQFMEEFDKFCELAKEGVEYADFLIVYIEEAHPLDGWSFKDSHKIKKHRKLEDRIAAAQLLADRKPPCPVVVDSMTDDANTGYGGLFDRLVIIDGPGRVAYGGHRGPDGYSLVEVGVFLAVKVASRLSTAKIEELVKLRLQNRTQVTG